MKTCKFALSLFLVQVKVCGHSIAVWSRSGRSSREQDARKSIICRRSGPPSNHWSNAFRVFLHDNLMSRRLQYKQVERGVAYVISKSLKFLVSPVFSCTLNQEC
jgi:hypothetical protein